MSTPDLDLVVLGAGVQGAGVAQAAAAAGWRVRVLELRRAGWATSSRSSKLIHGGLRYLESHQFRLVRESLRERAILLRVAPHLVRLVPFHVPVYRGMRRGPWTLRAGLSLYALLGNLRRDARFQALPRDTWDDLDGLERSGLRAVFRYQDGQTDDALLTRTVLASARDLGAEVFEHTEALGGRRVGDAWQVRFRVGDGVREVTTRAVVNAAGPWATRLGERFAPAPPLPAVELVGGAHLELEGRLERGIYYTEAADGRAVFHMPWRDRVLVGTTETPYRGDPAQVACTDAEEAYLLEVHRRHFPGRDPRVLDRWAGLRVLPRSEGAAFGRSRDVMLVPDRRERPSFVTVIGGKLTGYRETAEKVERLLAPGLPRAERLADTRTLRLPNLGSGAGADAGTGGGA